MIDVPGATPSQLVPGAWGKDGNTYFLNRNNLGGITAPVTARQMSWAQRLRGHIGGYTHVPGQETYSAFHDDGNAITAYRITAANPPGIVSAWSIGQGGRGSPWSRQRTAPTTQLSGWLGVARRPAAPRLQCRYRCGCIAHRWWHKRVNGWHTPAGIPGSSLEAGFIFAADNKVYAFKLPTATPTPTPTAAQQPPRLRRRPQPSTPTPTPVPSPTPTATVTPRATPTPGQITLTARGYKVQGRHTVDLSWGGAAGSDVDIYRNGVVVVWNGNDGFYTDSPGGRGHATYTYKVCQAGTQTCSNQVTVTF